MSKKIIDKSSILLGMGDVYVLDAAAGNYSSNTSISTNSNLLGRMENVRIYSKRDITVTKQIVNGLIHDDDAIVEGAEFFLEFNLYEHTTKTQAALFGGALVDISTALGAILNSPKKLRFEVKFTFPIGNKYMWYIFPRCISTSELDFGPTNTEGHKMKGLFRALPATNEHAIWYTSTTPCFHNYII
jgi:hypothetical protein